jgi:hypothetical protein
VSNSVWLRNLKGGGQVPIWAVEPLDGWMDEGTDIRMCGCFKRLLDYTDADKGALHRTLCSPVWNTCCTSDCTDMKWFSGLNKSKTVNITPVEYTNFSNAILAANLRLCELLTRLGEKTMGIKHRSSRS